MELKPTIILPFSEDALVRLREHVSQIRLAYDWPGIPYHDASHAPADKFNRWFWHNLPLLVEMHHHPELLALASDVFGQPVKPSYVFLSMYGPEGVCPPHQDRPQCQFTIDLLINSNHKNVAWPIYVDKIPYILRTPGEALAYSGTNQLHFRNPMQEDSDATKVDLAFFHFVPTTWMGAVS